MTAAASGLALGGCAAGKLVQLAADEEWPSGVERLVASSCLQCEGGCGIIARVVDGHVVKLEGNPLHPVNRGRLCPLGHAGLQVLYNPDRIKAPMKRVGGKGSSDWIKISWDDAISTVADHLGGLRERGEPHSLVVFDGHRRGLMRSLLERFCEAYGTPNHLCACQPDGMTVAHDLAQGMDELFGYDLEKTNYILSFGCGLLDGWRSPVGVARAYGFLRQERPGAKAKIVQVERRFSTTAARSDQWIPINPGTEAALALGIAYVIIREQLYDLEFVQNYTFGFDDWKDAQGETRLGFKSVVLKEYRPDDVAGMTGVPVDAIIKVAKEFAMNRPAVALADRNSTSYSNGAYTGMAIHALNALVGNIDAPGGIIAEGPLPLTPMPDVKRDAVAERGLSMSRIDQGETGEFPLATSVVEMVPDNILADTPYQVGAVFLYNSNPVFSTRIEAKFRQALGKVPLVVSFSSFIDETAEHADLILPDHLFLEKWQDSVPPPLLGTPVLGIAQPVVEPLYDTMHTGDFILKLAGAIGSPVAEAFPWSDFKEMLRFSVEGIHEAGRGAMFAEPFEEAYAREMQQRGWATNEFSSYDDFWEEMVNKGGWSGLYRSYGRWGKVFRTPSNKYEFYSQSLKGKLETLARASGKTVDDTLTDLRVEARGDKAFLPHYEPIKSDAAEAEYPFYLNPFNSLVLNSDASANLPWIQEIVGPHVGVQWDWWAEVSPSAASELGIAEGDWVWIESPRGKLKAKAKLYLGAMPNVINVPSGLGHKAYGRWARDVGANPNSLVEVTHDRLSGLPAWFSTRVKVYKA